MHATSLKKLLGAGKCAQYIHESKRIINLSVLEQTLLLMLARSSTLQVPVDQPISNFADVSKNNHS